LILPEITDSFGVFGVVDRVHFGLSLPICGLAGDQQAAAIGQGCLIPGQCKATYGTGAFILSPTGRTAIGSRNRLLSTIAWQAAGERYYILEGSIFVAGSLIQWLRDSLGILGSSAETADLAASVPDNGGVYLVPALTGLGAPHWRPDVRGQITGLTFGTGRAHIARAALEAMAYQTRDLQDAFEADGAPWAALRIDGGMAANHWMAQDVADILDMPVLRPAFIETTAKGAAMLAAVGAGIFPSLTSAVEVMAGSASSFMPSITAGERARRLAGWSTALSGALASATD
jgi:glycerol kinase